MIRAQRRPRFCKFTVGGIKSIDYKDLEILRTNISDTGKILPTAQHRHQGALPAATGYCGQARPLSCADSLHRPARQLGPDKPADN